VPSAKIRRAEAERQCRAAEQARRTHDATIEDLKARIVAEQTRLDGLSTEVSEAQQKLTATHQAADDLKAQLEHDLSERRAAADRALVEVERQHHERRTELEAEERDLVARIQALRDELRSLAAKAGAL
jgi:chromosome segregation ATPase